MLLGTSTMAGLDIFSPISQKKSLVLYYLTTNQKSKITISYSLKLFRTHLSRKLKCHRQ
jgi:hypothetical protein